MTTPETKQGEDAASEAQPTLLEQMGGLSGLVSSTLPIVVLAPVNARWGLTPALVSAVGVALVIAAVRLVRKQTMQPAVSGFVGVVLCAAIAWYMGDAKGYFLYGIWMALLLGIGCFISLLVRWPAVGLVWEGVKGDGTAWRAVPAMRRSYGWATAAWGIVFFARFFIQHYLYGEASTNALAIARILMGWPLTIAVSFFTVLMVRRASRAHQVAHPTTTDIELKEEPLE